MTIRRLSRPLLAGVLAASFQLPAASFQPSAASFQLPASSSRTAVGAQKPTPVPPLTLQRLEEIALQNNPTLRQAQAQIEAARGRARQAGAWPNPVIGYTAEEIPLRNDVRGGQHGVFVEQTVLLGGKRRLAGDVFRAEGAEAEALAALQRQRVLNTVRRSFYRSLAAQRRVDVQERLSSLVDEAVVVSRQLANVGAADKPDVLESEVEAFRARLELEQAKNRRAAVWRELSAVVGDPALPLQPLEGNIEAAVTEIDRDAALQQVLSRSPELAAARAAVERSRALVAQSGRAAFPDVFLRGEFTNNREPLEGAAARNVGPQFGLEAGVSLPLFDRNRGAISAARADLSRAESEARRIELELQSRFAGIYEQYLTALRSSETYRVEILPRAEEAYKLYLARYREMGAAYPQVLIARRSLLELSDAYLASLDAAARAVVDLQGFLAGDGLSAPARPGDPIEGSIETARTGSSDRGSRNED